jgi:hypothetical protein
MIQTAFRPATSRSARVEPDGVPATFALPTPFFSLAFPESIEVAPGGSATATVRVRREPGFSFPIELRLVWPFVGFGASFARETAADGSAVMTLRAGEGLRPGRYPAAIQGTTPGGLARTATIDVVVRAR